MAVHRGDLRVVGSGLRDALTDRPDWRFHVVGRSAGVGEELCLGAVRSETGWLPMPDYIQSLSDLSIGITPIADTPFNESKSYLKSLEMAALGVPHVSSDMPEYRRLGAALLASKPKFWRGILRSLMDDHELRIEQAIKARDLASRHTYELHAPKFMAAWTGMVAVESTDDDVLSVA